MWRTDDTLVDATELVDQVTGGGRLAGIDVANDHDVEVSLQQGCIQLVSLKVGIRLHAWGTFTSITGHREGPHLLLTHLGKLIVSCVRNKCSLAQMIQSLRSRRRTTGYSRQLGNKESM